MVTKEMIDDFLAQSKIAVVGVSRDPRKFGRTVYKDLKHKGYQVFAINPNASEVLGDPCYASLADLPEKVDGIVTVVPPAETEKAVQEAARLGIPRVWMQAGSESQRAIDFCKQNGIRAIHNECIMMFAVNKFPHNMHRWVNKVVGKLPK